MTRRSIVLLTGLVAFACTASFAQMKTQLGFNAGLSMFHETGTSGSISVSNDTKTGFVGGAVLDFWLVDVFAIEPGISFSMRGGEFSDTGITVSTASDNLAYLTLPVHMKLRWPGIPVISPYGLVGLNIGILLSATEDVGGTSHDFSSDVNSMSFGLDFGAGLDFDLPGIVPYIEFVYDMGVSNLAKNAPSDASMKTSGSELKVGIRFKI